MVCSFNTLLFLAFYFVCQFATTSQVVVVATAGSLDSVCPSMRTQDTFSVDIEVTPPTADERVQVDGALSYVHASSCAVVSSTVLYT